MYSYAQCKSGSNSNRDDRKMTRKQYYMALAVLVVAGLAGGVLGSLIAHKLVA